MESSSSSITIAIATATLVGHPVVEVAHPFTFDGDLRIHKTQRVDVIPVIGEPYSETVEFWYDHGGQLARVTSRRI